MMIKQFGFRLGLGLLLLFQAGRLLMWSDPLYVSQSASMTGDKKNKSSCRMKEARDDVPSAEQINVTMTDCQPYDQEGRTFRRQIENQKFIQPSIGFDQTSSHHT